jgi:hypothetical protein
MNKLIKKLEDLMVAITFAEAGEYDEAIRLSGENLNAPEELEEPLKGLAKGVLENAHK